MSSVEELHKRFPEVKFYGPASVKEGVEIGEGTGVGEWVFIGAGTKIGRNCTILYHVTLSKDCRIGNHVFIGPNTTLLNDKFPPSKASLPPIIRDGAILGGGVTVLPGVVVGECVVVGAGSVVTRDVQGWTVVAGNPAKNLYGRIVYDRKQREYIRKYSFREVGDSSP